MCVDALVFEQIEAAPRNAQTFAFVDPVRRRESALHQGLGGDEVHHGTDLDADEATLEKILPRS
jgi:hypothetical protein